MSGKCTSKIGSLFNVGIRAIWLLTWNRVSQWLTIYHSSCIGSQNFNILYLLVRAVVQETFLNIRWSNRLANVNTNILLTHCYNIWTWSKCRHCIY